MLSHFYRVNLLVKVLFEQELLLGTMTYSLFHSAPAVLPTNTYFYLFYQQLYDYCD